LGTPEAVSVLGRRPTWAIGILVLLLSVGAFAGYVAGRDPRVVTEEVGCLSASRVIGCTLRDGWDLSVPLDVAWTDASGAFHEGGRPDCLPPTGHGLEGPVRVAWTDVEVDGRRWRQVLSVTCLG